MDIFREGHYSAHTGCHQEGEHKNRLYGEGEVSSEQVGAKMPVGHPGELSLGFHLVTKH